MAGSLATLVVSALLPEAAYAAVHAEPDNALSFPTWAIHVSSVAEWCAAVKVVAHTTAMARVLRGSSFNEAVLVITSLFLIKSLPI